jgi:hypothetical protein
MRVSKLLSQIKPWEPAIKARPHKKWKEGRPTKNTFYFERAARTLLEGTACVRLPFVKFQLFPLDGQKTVCLLSFPYVCPEPVLAK